LPTSFPEHNSKTVEDISTNLLHILSRQPRCAFCYYIYM